MNQTKPEYNQIVIVFEIKNSESGKDLSFRLNENNDDCWYLIISDGTFRFSKTRMKLFHKKTLQNISMVNNDKENKKSTATLHMPTDHFSPCTGEIRPQRQQCHKA